MRNKTLSIIKKSHLIVLVFITFSFITIFGHLRVNAKLALYKEACFRYFAF